MTLLTRGFRACLASPQRMALAAVAITPGMHLLLSLAVERREVTWSSEYPAVLVGDPLLALATGIAARVAGVDTVLESAPLRRPLAPVIVGAAAVFGALQLRDELRRGVYTRQQAFSPSKLWHQFVVYPTMSPLVAGALVSATATAISPQAGRKERVGTALAWGCVAVWGALVVEAIQHPRPGHGTFDWLRICRAG